MRSALMYSVATGLAAVLGCGNVGGAGDASAGDSAAATDSLSSAEAANGLDAQVSDVAAPSADATEDVVGPSDAASDASCSVVEVDSGPGCPSAFGPQCGVPTQCGPVVESTEVLATQPPALGGTVASGLYYLTAVTFYRSQSGPEDSYQISLQINGADFAERSYEHGFEGSPLAGSYTANGTTLQRNITCPITTTDVDQYTATSTTLTIYLTTTGCFPGTTALTFQLQ